MADILIANDIRKIFSLKNILFTTFDCSALGHGLNRTQERVLMMSWHAGGAPMSYLSREAGLEKGSLTTVIDTLESAGLLIRERDTTDKRLFIVTPTSKGSDLAQEIEKYFLNHLETILGKLTNKERAEFEIAARTFARLIPILST